MNRKKAAAIIAIVFTCVIWGFSFLSIKVSVTVIPPVTLALYRFIIATAVLFVIMIARNGGKLPPVERKDMPRFVFGGLTGISLYFLFENYGVKLTNASIASIIIATIPVFSVLADRIVYKTRLSVWNLTGVFLSLAGVAMVVNFRGTLATDPMSLVGYALMFMTAVMWVLYNFITRPLNKKYAGLTVTFYQTLFGTMFLLLMSLVELPSGKAWQPVSWTVVWNVLFLALFCSAAGYFLYIYSLSVLGVQPTMIFINLIPVVTVIAGYFILGERIELLQIAGGVLVVFAVILSNLSSNRGQKARKKFENGRIS